ncbi:MAG: TetR/AcrR family transcriptional regulator [Pseudomonadota bacterium]
MPRPQATPEQKRAARRAILAAAAALYRESGLTDISARAIAARAEVSVGTLYTHFASVVEILQALWQKPVAQVSAELEAIAAATPNPEARLRALLRHYAQFALANPAVYRGAFLHVRAEPLPKDARMSPEATAMHRLLTEAIRAGQGQGELVTGNPEILAQVLWAGIHGVLALPQNLDRVALNPAQGQLEPMIDLLMRGLAATKSN